LPHGGAEVRSLLIICGHVLVTRHGRHFTVEQIRMAMVVRRDKALSKEDNRITTQDHEKGSDNEHCLLRVTDGPCPNLRAPAPSRWRDLIHAARTLGAIDRSEPRARSLLRNAQHSNAALAVDPLLDEVNLDHSDARSVVLAPKHRGIDSGGGIREQ
jgi:hypothetical protein